MPLDWTEVEKRYPAGTIVPAGTSGRHLEIVEVDDGQVQIRTSLWQKSLQRAHLEEAVRLIEKGTMSHHLTDFVEQYGKYITTERRTLAAHVLKDLGFID
jgi:hypothetical protein